MRLIMVRHGEPDYANDCLTQTGRLQAGAAAQRLMEEDITEIYASPMGRAQQTAQAASGLLGLPVTTLLFMREVIWSGERDVPFNGHPWLAADQMVSQGDSILAPDWRSHPYFRDNAVLGCYDLIAEEIDAFLAQKGYRHEGERYWCTAEKEENIALFSHGGSGSCAIAHMLSLPLPLVTTLMRYDFTSVTVLQFPFKPGEWVFPRLGLNNDARHIHPGSHTAVLQKEPG